MRYYELHLRDTVTYVNKEKYQTLREAVNALLHSEKVDLPRLPDEAFEFAEAPQGVPDEYTDTFFDKYEAAASVSKKPNRDAAKAGEQVKPELPDPEPVSPNVEQDS